MGEAEGWAEDESDRADQVPETNCQVSACLMFCKTHPRQRTDQNEAATLSHDARRARRLPPATPNSPCHPMSSGRGRHHLCCTSRTSTVLASTNPTPPTTRSQPLARVVNKPPQVQARQSPRQQRRRSTPSFSWAADSEPVAIPPRPGLKRTLGQPEEDDGDNAVTPFCEAWDDSGKADAVNRSAGSTLRKPGKGGQ